MLNAVNGVLINWFSLQEPVMDTLDKPQVADASRIEYSGAHWASRFPASRALHDLAHPFRARVEAFIASLRDAGATVTVNATRRDARRAYLMYWSWRIVNDQVDPRTIPPRDGVRIVWAHVDEAGDYSRTESIEAAREMLRAYGIDGLGVAPTLVSRHLEGCAIDMSISWRGRLSVLDGRGEIAQITSAPWTGMNAQLQEVGASFGVIKYKRDGRDEPHWSDTGA